MKRYALILVSFFLLAGSLSLIRQKVVRSQIETGAPSAAGTSSISPAPTSLPAPTATTQNLFFGGGGGIQDPSPTPTPFSANPFTHTPLPVNRGGP